MEAPEVEHAQLAEDDLGGEAPRPARRGLVSSPQDTHKGSSLMFIDCNLDAPALAIELLIRSSAGPNRTTRGMIH